MFLAYHTFLTCPTIMERNSVNPSIPTDTTRNMSFPQTTQCLPSGDFDIEEYAWGDFSAKEATVGDGIVPKMYVLFTVLLFNVCCVRCFIKFTPLSRCEELMVYTIYC